MNNNPNKIELVVHGLAYHKKINKIQALFSKEEITCQLILAKKDQLDLGIVIIIGVLEAQSIAIMLEKMEPKRPLTYDLFKSTMEVFNLNLDYIFINKLDSQRIFHCLLVWSNNDKINEVDGRAADAINLALRFKCPIYIDKDIFDKISVEVR